MTGHPRFEPVKGPPDVAYKNYYGAPLVGLVFRLVDAWRAKTAPGERALDPSSGRIEMHERMPIRSPAGSSLAMVEPVAPASGRVAPDERFSAEFLVGSARTMRLQAGLLIAFVAVLTLLVTQMIVSPHHTGGQTAQQSRHPSTAAAGPTSLAAKLRRAENFAAP